MSPASSTGVVLFDLDGTLIATRRLYLEAYRLALQPFLGRLVSDAEILAGDPRSERRFLASMVAELEVQQCHSAFWQHYAELHQTHFEGVFPGIPEMLAELGRNGIAMGLVTGKSRQTWQITSAALPGFADRFSVVVVDDDVAEAKPDPQGIRLALETMKADPAASAYVGDSVADIGAAVAAGVQPIAALWGKRNPALRQRLIEHGRAAQGTLAEAPADLVTLLTCSNR